MNDKITFYSNELFKKLCNRAPGDAEILLFDKLRQSSNIPKQTSLTVSTKYRHDICQNNPNASEFENIFQQLSKANLKELDPLISLINSIKKIPETLDMLSHNCSIQDSSVDLNYASYDRSRSINKTIDNSASIKCDIPSSDNSLSGSPYLTMDFVDTNTLMLPPQAIPSIKTLDKSSQEKVLIKDLMYCLMGNHGIYIKALPIINDRQFEIDSSMYSGFLDIVKAILRVCSNVSNVTRFVDEYSKYEYGNVNQALASAINTQIKDFRLLVCQMEELYLNGSLTLTGMLNYIEEPGNLMLCISDICKDIVDSKCRGGAVLSLFYRHGLSAGSPKKKVLINHLMKCATVPFFRILKIWIFRGLISDQYQEFFIKDNGTHNIQKWKPNIINISPTYWSNNYIIEDSLIPRFLEIHVQKILDTGKYLNVIQLCGGDADFPVIEDMEYENEEQHFLLQIDKAYQYASKLLMDIMFRDKRLNDHFQIMKHYFLLDQADWLSHFMYSANDELNEKISDCQIGRLESLLDVAIQAGNTTTDSLKENITIELSNQELIPFIYHILKFNPRNVGSLQQKDVTGQNLSVLEAFSLKITTEWPISLILNSSVVQRYQILFRHIFYCHHVERVLFSVWSSNKCSSTGHFGNFHLINKASILGNNMRNFIQHLIYYMTTEVIEPFWIAFKTKLDQAQNLDDVLKFHDDFLQACLVNCTGSTSMLKSLQKIMMLCVTYCNRFNRLRSSDFKQKNHNVDSFNRQADTEDISQMYDQESFEKIINHDQTTFRNIAKEYINTIRNEKENKLWMKLVDRLEFNGFYNSRSSESDVD